MITSEELRDLLEQESVNINIKTSATFLVNAITDWPKYNLEEPSEFISE